VNRVHPTTGVAWDFSHDFRQIQASLRAIEQDYGLRVVPGRLASVSDRVVPDRADLTPGEFRQLQRGEAALIERVRAMAPVFREATSWADLTQQLASQGLRVERKGQGLIVTDGVSTVKASRVARDLSLRGLERRFGVSYADRDFTTMTPAMTARRDAIRADYVHSLTAHQYDVELTLQAVRERADRTHWTLHAEVALRNRQIATAFATVYRDPDRAQVAFQALHSAQGEAVAIATLRDHPEHLGALQTTERITWGGLRTQRDDSHARQHARVTADVLQTASTTAQSFSHRHDDTTRDVAVMERRAAQARAALTGLPSLATLERSLSLQASRLLPPELQQLRTWVTAPHRAVLPTPTGIVRSLVRESDERER